MQRHAFTLIELLVVVGVIAILAAIAVPNFLEAQTRSKITRIKSDQRTIATALEAYCVDTNQYPPEAMLSAVLPLPLNPDAAECLISLTTPVAYLTSTEAAKDPFLRDGDATNRSSGQQFEQYHFFYTNYRTFSTARGVFDPLGQPYMYAGWGLSSFGPDKADDGILFAPIRGMANLTTWGLIAYDPTNGTTSLGDVPRYGGSLPGDVLMALNPR